jgi:hypothetical protein
MLNCFRIPSNSPSFRSIEFGGGAHSERTLREPCPRRLRRRFQSGSWPGERSPSEGGPYIVFTNPIHLDVKPADRTSDCCRLTRYDFLDERIIADARSQGPGFKFSGSERAYPRNRLRHPLNASALHTIDPSGSGTPRPGPLKCPGSTSVGPLRLGSRPRVQPTQ